jgi:eukaryotic-like serine/threonine-protein kinase
MTTIVHGHTGRRWRITGPAPDQDPSLPFVCLAEADDPSATRAVIKRFYHQHPALFDDVRRRRFFQEVAPLCAVRHPNAIAWLDLGVSPWPDRGGEEWPWIAMAWHDGETLGAIVERAGRLSIEQTTARLTEITAGVSAFAAIGVICASLSPRHVMVGRDDRAAIWDHDCVGGGDDDRPGPLHDGNRTRAGAYPKETSWFVSELARGTPTTTRTTAAQLALLSFELLTGERYWREESFMAQVVRILTDAYPTPSSLTSAPLPRGYDDWFLRAIARDPADRFADAPAALAAWTRVARSYVHLVR